MDDNFNYLFQYLETEKIQFNKTEFLFQMQSHPDYPSLLSISDTLTFFKIDNVVVKLSFDEIEMMLNFFVSLLKENNKSRPKFYLIKRDKNKYFLFGTKKIIEIKKEALLSRWTDINLLIENNTIEEIIKQKNINEKVLNSLCLLQLIALFVQSSNSLKSKLFFILPAIGFLFSIAALKDLFGVKSELIKNLCNFTSSSNCNDIVNSNKWKVFEYINFSDLSIVFFSSQILLYLISMILGIDKYYFSLQYLLILPSLPITLISIYYQKYIEKKWCPICLIIISIIFLEFSYMLISIDYKLSFSLKIITIYVLLLSFIISSWFALKKVLMSIKNLKELQLKSNRFNRNYQNFRKILISNDKRTLPYKTLNIGNNKSKVEITIITHPFCIYCKKAHEDLEKILEKYPNNIQIRIIFKVNIDEYDQDTKKFFRHLINIYNDDSQELFIKAIKKWFELSDEKEWMKLFPETQNNQNTENLDMLYKMHNDWCVENNINYTPMLLINGYEYPKSYDRENLEFFINELIEDKF